MSRSRLFALVFAGLVLTTGLLIPYALPAVAATLCPSCYGLQKIGPRLYSDIPDPELATAIAAAKAQVATVWPDPQANPFVLVCHSPDCDHRLGGRGARGMSYGAWIIRLSPTGANQTIAAHELAHAELHHRLGLWGWWENTVPAWLNEGIAVLISQDARYLNRPKDCAALRPQDLPQTAQDWSHRASTDHDRLYTQAACAATDWLQDKGGLANLPALFP